MTTTTTMMRMSDKPLLHYITLLYSCHLDFLTVPWGSHEGRRCSRMNCPRVYTLVTLTF
jgi:hypothetical protein